MTDSLTEYAPTHRVRLGYLLAGAVVGALWVAQTGAPLWEHAVRLLGLMAIVTLASALRRRMARNAPRHPIARFLAAKVALVMLAVIAALCLSGRIDNVDMWIGIGLFAVTAAAGPFLHPWLAGSRRPRTGSPASTAEIEETRV